MTRGGPAPADSPGHLPAREHSLQRLYLRLVLLHQATLLFERFQDPHCLLQEPPVRRSAGRANPRERNREIHLVVGPIGFGLGQALGDGQGFLVGLAGLLALAQRD